MNKEEQLEQLSKKMFHELERMNMFHSSALGTIRLNKFRDELRKLGVDIDDVSDSIEESV